jgi:cation transport regulator ChaB
MPIEKPEDLPSTLQRSDEHAQAIFTETLNSAEGTYGPGERARRTAFASLKHSYEKVGDHWEPKKQRGPSDEQARRGTPDSREPGRTYGGVDVEGHTKQELYERAKALGVRAASKLTKDELAEAIDKANQKATRKAREGERAEG